MGRESGEGVGVGWEGSERGGVGGREGSIRGTKERKKSH